MRVGRKWPTLRSDRERMVTHRYGRLATTAACCGFIGLGLLAGAVLARGPALSMLDRLQPGLWELRERGNDGGRRQVCVDHGRNLVQVRHAGERCSSLTAEDTPGAVTVQYACQTTGYGRTRIRFENPGLVQIDTQGIAGGLPFDFTAEARRVGDCPG